MANTSSFEFKKIKEDRRCHFNRTCFADIRHVSEDTEINILIEPDKLEAAEITYDDVVLYVERLKEAGLNYGEISISKDDPLIPDGTIKIGIDSTQNEVIRVICSTALRYMWEGKYLPKYSKVTYDKFYHIYEHFMRMCDLYPKMDRGILLCLAHNIAFYNCPRYKFNGNHCWIIALNGCKMLTSKKIKSILANNRIASMNDTFSIPAFKLEYLFQSVSKDITVRRKRTTKNFYSRLINNYNRKHNK